MIANRFEIGDPGQDIIGRGGMGVVYLGRDSVTGQVVAIKALKPEVVANNPDIVARFIREGEALRQLNHPNIIEMISVAEDEDPVTGAVTHYLMMEYLPGGSLRDMLEAEASLDIGRVLELGLDLSDALTRAHRLGIVHRDLKPENVLIAADGTAKLTDFGLAQVMGSSRLTQTGVLMGTLDYLSPEACNGQPLDRRTDIWAFGIMLYELLASRRPFTGETVAAILTSILTQPIPDLSLAVRGIPTRLVDLISSMLEKNPEIRMPSMRLVGAELEVILEQGERGVPTSHTSEWTTDISPIPLRSSQPPGFLTSTIRETPTLEWGQFVGRKDELDFLHQGLDKTLEGQGRVLFVSGEAGSGKSTLLNAFSKQALETSSDLLIAVGSCNAFTGRGDPYLPFREVLAMLTGDVVDRWEAGLISTVWSRRLWENMSLVLEILLDRGPSMVEMFISGNSLLTRAEIGLAGNTEILGLLAEQVARSKAVQGEGRSVGETGQLFNMITNFLKSLAVHCPLILILDDLHWIDSSSLDLLFHLGRSLEGSRILVVGTFRREEITSKDPHQPHPLDTLVNEFKRLFGVIEVDLDLSGYNSGLDFINELLDSSANTLDESFRQALFDHTEGQALFTVELLRALQDEGSLAQDIYGHWFTKPELNWMTIPARTEGVIAQRINRLSPELRRHLNLGSIQGTNFLAEAIAKVQGLDARLVVSSLANELERRHRLIQAGKVQRIGQSRLSMYQFRHNLFQRYVYDNLDRAERAYLHEDTGISLEVIYGDRAKQISVQLAWHFSEADLAEKAAHYTFLAGNQARDRYANEEAIQHYRQAKNLIGSRYQGSGKFKDLKSAIDEALGRVLELMGSHQEAREAFDSSLSMADSDRPERIARLWRLMGDTHKSQGRYEEAENCYLTAEKSLGLDPTTPEPDRCREWIDIQFSRKDVYYGRGDAHTMRILSRRMRWALEEYGTEDQRIEYLVMTIQADFRNSRFIISNDTLALGKELLELHRSKDNLTDIGGSEFRQGLMHLLRRELRTAEDHFFQAASLAERTGNEGQAVLCHAYLATLYRMLNEKHRCRVQTELCQEKAADLQMETYHGMALAQFAWLAWGEDRNEEAKAIGLKALLLWKDSVYPFQWAALFPLTAIALDEGHHATALEYCRLLLDPSQQRMPIDLNGGLEKAIESFEEGRMKEFQSAIGHSLDLARRYRYL